MYNRIQFYKITVVLNIVWIYEYKKINFIVKIGTFKMLFLEYFMVNN